MYEALILVHAVTATMALLASLRSVSRRWFIVYDACLIAMLVSLVAAIAVDGGDRDTTRQVIAVALVGVGAVMVGHAEAARRAPRGSPAFVRHVGFTVVGLVDAFVVVTVVQTDAPGALAAMLGIAIALVGHVAVKAAASRASEVERPAA